MKRTICALVVVALGCLVTPGTAVAIDGQVAVTQARAMAGGVTPGDTPGFPVSINLPGSYVLASGLTVPDANTTAIEINASHVTVDLNGFAILGPTDCSGGTEPCADYGIGSGIATGGAARFNITVRGGTIQGMGGMGVHLFGDSHLVEYMHLRSNGAYGVSVGSSADEGASIVRHNTVQRNGSHGISVDNGIVADNTVNTNGGFGILVEAGLVRNNVVNRNRTGMFLGSPTIYIGNAMTGNRNNDEVAGFGRNGGQNLCNSSPCPGAVF